MHKIGQMGTPKIPLELTEMEKEFLFAYKKLSKKDQDDMKTMMFKARNRRQN